MLKAAFVQGLLDKDEFDLRIGQVLASRTYTELAALTADIPARLTAAQPLSEPALNSANKKAVKVWAGVTAAFTGMSVVVAAANGERFIALVAFLVPVAAMLVAVLLAFHAWLDRRAGRQSSQGLPPGAGGEASQRPVSADVAGQLPQVNRNPRHTTEARPGRGPASRCPAGGHRIDGALSGAGTRSDAPATDPTLHRRESNRAAIRHYSAADFPS